MWSGVFWGPIVDQASALLNAMRAAASLGDRKLDPVRVEALATALGIDRERLPELVTELQSAGKVTIAWGGNVEVLQEPGREQASSGGGTIINVHGSISGHGTTIAGRDATGGTVRATPEKAVSDLAAIVMKLQSVRSGLREEAAEAADKTIEALTARPSASASLEIRRSWASSAMTWLGKLLALAPEVKDAVELGQEAIKAISGT
jgi:hypothetical protein